MPRLMLIAACIGWITAAPCQQAVPAQDDIDIELLPFDERIYDLSFRIFLANRNLEDAHRVAAAAVRQRPADPKWRERLAQLSEWTQQPEQALAHWRDLARSQDDEKAWDAVRRLAPGLYDYDSVITVLERDARRRQLTGEELRQLVQAYEAAGKPRQGIAFLKRLDRAAPHREYLKQVAFLEQRVGDDAEALATLEELITRYGPHTEWGISAATLYVLHGDVDAAYAVLARTRSAAKPSDAAYWAMLAELALMTQHRAEAHRALLTLAEQGKGNAEQLLAVMALLNTYPEDGLRVAEEGWRLHRDQRFLRRALEHHVQLGTLARGEALLKTVDAATLSALGNDAGFLIARGHLRQYQGRLAEASADIEKALAIAPHDPAVRLAWLWLLIVLRDDARLRATLSDLDAGLAISPATIDVLTAAYVSLGDFRSALPLYSRRWNERRDDPVWLVDYSEALATAGYAELAYRVQQRALKLLRAQATAAPRSAWPPAARLALAHTPGDPAARIVAALLEPGSHHVDTATADVLLLWLMRSAQYDRARLWLWRRYVHALARPAWAEFTVALAQRDRPLLGEMLAEDAIRRRVDPHDRVEAAIFLDEPFLARHYAFDALESDREDAILHGQLQRLMPDTARILRLERSYATRGTIEGPQTSLAGRWPLTRTLSIESGISYTEWDEAVETGIRNVPGTDWMMDIRLSRRHLRRARSSLRAGVRNALASFPYAELAHERPLGRLDSRLSLGAGLIADEGSAIRVGGRRDNLQLDLSWTPGDRSFITTELGASRYDTQDGQELGRGHRVIATVGYKLPLNHSDYTLRAVAGWYDYSLEGTIAGKAAQLAPAGTTPAASFFLPEDFWIVGVSAGFGESNRESHTRRWRPFTDAGVTHNSVSGLGFRVSGGIAGRVIGDDRLALAFERIDGEGGLGETDQIISLTYRYYY